MSEKNENYEDYIIRMGELDKPKDPAQAIAEEFLEWKKKK